MRSPFSFKGEIGRVAYAAGALSAFFSQHVAVFVLYEVRDQPLIVDLQFLLFPLRFPYWANVMVWMWWAPVFALPLTLVVALVLAGLSFRRAADANTHPWIAAASVLPVVQLASILFLCLAPPRKREAGAPFVADTADGGFSWSIAAQGMLAGTAFTVFSVALGALVFGTYGYGMFVLSPIMIGAITGYLANRRGDIGPARTAGLALGATVLGGLALVAVALEGVVCLALAFPLTIGFALLGGMLGATIARSRRSSTFSVMSVALLPVAFGAERAFPPVAHFDSYQTIEIAAPPDVVWQAIVHMKRIDAPPPIPFRLGVSYPIGGEFVGTGLGALRRGEFSTGIATERVTEWTLNKRLTLEVLNNPPAMRELSPYEHVHAPHVSGYFSTMSMSFEIQLRANGSVLMERTSHELKLDPLWYWLPLARWMVEQNNARVLAHIKQQASTSE